MIIDLKSSMISSNIIQSWIVCFASAKNKTLDLPLVFSVPTLSFVFEKTNLKESFLLRGETMWKTFGKG